MEQCMCNVYPQTHLYPRTLLDTKDSILALLEVVRLHPFEKVLGELVVQLDQLQDAKPKHKSENSTETRQKLQKVHSWYTLVHIHLKHQCCLKRLDHHRLWRYHVEGVTKSFNNEDERCCSNPD